VHQSINPDLSEHLSGRAAASFYSFKKLRSLGIEGPRDPQIPGLVLVLESFGSVYCAFASK
jgi:hypothetical protein